MTRVVVFIDYQNVYKRAREAFGLDGAAHWEGQIHPFAVGHELAGRATPGHHRTLQEVRIYRGLPDARRDPRGNAACLRQLQFWSSLPKVTPVKRPLQYPPQTSSRPPREKGIDVQIAVDLVMGAVNDAYDCAVVFSADTDLIPALDAVVELKGDHSVEVAAWQHNTGYGSRIRASTGPTWCHYLDRGVYQSVADLHDYNTQRPSGS
ncbi:MAG: NYN domain-containing protein [Egibacteraceae bacterium]